MTYKAYAATMQSVWFSEDEGHSWNRLLTPTGGFYNEARVWAVTTHPERPGEVLAGSDQGLYRFTEETGRFDYIPSPMDQLHILKIAQDPHDADCIVCGTRPGEIFVTEDNGESWTRSTLDASTECWFINTSRVTSIHFDPRDRDTIWITVEIDGVFRSTDRGKTWQLIIRGLHDNDSHDLVFRDHDDGSRTILCSTEDGVHRSFDNGETWEQMKIPQAKWDYFRSLKQPAENSDTVIASVGDKPSGEAGELLISRDFGESWDICTMSHKANSTLWSIGTNPADTSLLFAATIFGQIFKSTDGGANWQKMARELGEIRMITWAPV
ncbi:MAG: hypothetical protein NXI27_21200 [Alphaproteobacteria bacterium]|nr:hypothetical protein [Alphaproteobacteria bacterium]